MRLAKSGAQRASRHRSLLLALSVALVALLGVSPVTSAAASAPWYNVEVYYLKLLNCTRTGGWVRSDGVCLAYGTGKYSKYVPPIRLSAGLSNNVSRPYALLLVRRNACSHFLAGDPGARLRRAGYTNYVWGENIGCRWGYSNVYKAVLASHRVFQSEKSWNGGHWRNIKSKTFRYVGIGIWYSKYAGVRLVTDFYSPS